MIDILLFSLAWILCGFGVAWSLGRVSDRLTRSTDGQPGRDKAQYTTGQRGTVFDFEQYVASRRRTGRPL